MNQLLYPDIVGSYLQGAQGRQALQSNEQAMKMNEMKMAEAQRQRSQQQQLNQLLQSGLPPEQMSQQIAQTGNIELANQILENVSKLNKVQQDRIMTGAQNVYAFTKGAKDANDPVFQQGIQKALESGMIDQPGAQIAYRLGPQGLEQFVAGDQQMTPYQRESLALQREKMQQDTKDLSQKRGGELFQMEDKMRSSFEKQSGDFIKVRDAYGRISASATDPSPAGDLSLIFNYMKVLDPGSTVREGEFATAQNAGGIDSTIRNFYNRIASGERLNEAQRTDFVGRASKLYDAQLKGQEQLEKDYISKAKRYELNPENIITDYRVNYDTKPDQKPKQPAQLPATNSKGWVLMTDAQGNRAYVGPNNEVEEVK